MKLSANFVQHPFTFLMTELSTVSQPAIKLPHDFRFLCLKNLIAKRLMLKIVLARKSTQGKQDSHPYGNHSITSVTCSDDPSTDHAYPDTKE